MRPIFEIVGCITEITRTVLYASLIQEHIQSLEAHGPVPFLNLFGYYFHIAEPWDLRSPRSTVCSVVVKEKHSQLP